MPNKEIKPDQKKRLTLRILTPDGIAADTPCDSVTMPLCDDKDGRGGGSIGIHRGHEQALFVLGQGYVCAIDGGKRTLKILIRSGIASVQSNVVAVVTDSAQSEPAGNSDKR